MEEKKWAKEAGKILLVGGGAREHAFAWMLANSPLVKLILAAPGNPGMVRIPKVKCMPIAPDAVDSLIHLAKKEKVRLVVIGPEGPLRLGLADQLKTAKIPVFGPTKDASEIEWSKSYGKYQMRECGIPTPPSSEFMNYRDALAYAEAHGAPLVVKKDGLAGGKGVEICFTLERVREVLRACFPHREERMTEDEPVILEDYLPQKDELSAQALVSDGEVRMYPFSRDYKTRDEDGQGPNTGGMGAFAPVPGVSMPFRRDVEEVVLKRMAHHLARCGRHYRGLMYPGLMRVPTGLGFTVLEYNARGGDPETQVYARLMKSDIYRLMFTVVDGTLNRCGVEWFPGCAVCVVIASGGYPSLETYPHYPIYGLESAEKIPGVVVFHAATAMEGGQLVTVGGRVLSVTAVGDTPRMARDRAYQAVECISFKDMHYRRDIGREFI